MDVITPGDNPFRLVFLPCAFYPGLNFHVYLREGQINKIALDNLAFNACGKVRQDPISNHRGRHLMPKN